MRREEGDLTEREEKENSNGVKKGGRESITLEGRDRERKREEESGEECLRTDKEDWMGKRKEERMEGEREGRKKGGWQGDRQEGGGRLRGEAEMDQRCDKEVGSGGRCEDVTEAFCGGALINGADQTMAVMAPSNYLPREPRRVDHSGNDLA